MTGERVIIHLDMDAFFAAIEQRDRPELRGRPVVVGADPQGGKGRGVASTCSYEAREFGIHSAMPIRQAYRRCPHAAFVPVDGAKYSRESKRIRDILGEFTPVVQMVSIDEGYLDVTGSLRLFGGKRCLAERIQERIEEETELTASLGVAPCKLVAKIASDLEKPRGLVIVEPDEVEAFLAPLEVRRLPGCGPKMREVLSRLGVETIGDLAALSEDDLREEFGEWGKDLHRKARGLDEGPVREGEGPKSIGHEHTFGEDTADRDELHRTLMRLCEKTAWRVRKAKVRGRTVTTKVRFEDFTTLTRQRTLPKPVCEATEIYVAAVENLKAARIGRRKVRLIGVQVSGFDRDAVVQTSLFAEAEEERDERRLRLARAEDVVKERFGEDALRRGASMRKKDRDED